MNTSATASAADPLPSSRSRTAAVLRAPRASHVTASDGVQLATYAAGNPAADRTVLVLHGFASSTASSWYATGWVRDLVATGNQVLAMDLRGHGASDKPETASSYSIDQLTNDVAAVLDARGPANRVSVLGYSLGARVGWCAMLHDHARYDRGVLGGGTDGTPLSRFNVVQARAFMQIGAPIEDPATYRYVRFAERSSSNDLSALVAFAEGLQRSAALDPTDSPAQPLMFITGSRDPFLTASRRLAAASPSGIFVEVPDRDHLNTLTAPVFRSGTMEFLNGGRSTRDESRKLHPLAEQREPSRVLRAT